MQVSPEMGTSFSEVLSPRDVATMGALCALASFSRAELKRQVVDNLGFREYLEAVPEVASCNLSIGPLLMIRIGGLGRWRMAVMHLLLLVL